MKMLNEKGFTLVELMVVVAIIGILSSVAIPNFRKYQAKAKTSEAKVQLAAAYTAEQAFYGDFGMYATCLDYMGYDPGVTASRYYAMGFSGQANAIDDTVYGEAENSGLASTLCADDLAATAGTTWFAAGKGSGGARIDTIGSMSGALAGSCAEALGNQATGNQTFQMAAVGIVSSDNNTYATSSCFTINQDKLIVTARPGY